MTQTSLYPNTFYRVSVKALVKDKGGRVLVLKENQDTWSLPGGGLDHGEMPEDGIRRELQEELGVSPTHAAPAKSLTFYLESRQSWLMWIVYEVSLASDDFTLGHGVTEALYIDLNELKDSQDIFEQQVVRASTP